MAGPAFDETAHDYDEIHQKLVKSSGFPVRYLNEQKARELHRALSGHSAFPLPAPAILDYGCGVGNIDPFLRKYFPGSRICAVDVSEESIAIAKSKHEAFDISYAVIDAAGNDLPFGDSFDLVLACGVLHHIPREGLPQAFSRIKAHLKPGGLLFIFEHNPYHPAIQWMFKNQEIKYDPRAAMLKPRYLREQLAKAGYIPARARYALFFPRFLSALLPLEKHMTGIPLGAQYYVTAENAKIQ